MKAAMTAASVGLVLVLWAVWYVLVMLPDVLGVV